MISSTFFALSLFLSLSLCLSLSLSKCPAFDPHVHRYRCLVDPMGRISNATQNCVALFGIQLEEMKAGLIPASGIVVGWDTPEVSPSFFLFFFFSSFFCQSFSNV